MKTDERLVLTILVLCRNKQRQSWSPLALASGTNAAVLERSEAYQRVAAIAKRTGIHLVSFQNATLFQYGMSSRSF